MKFHARAIPRFLLTDSVTLLTPNVFEGDIFCDGYDETELTNVRVEYNRKNRISGNNTASESAGVLYYDCKNSNPRNTAIKTEDKLKIGEKIYLITSVQTLCDTAPHHIKAVFR